MRSSVLILAFVLTVSSAGAETVVSFAPRGRSAQFFGLLNNDRSPDGAVVLLAGGNGRLDITQSGAVTYLKLNQLVRTRTRYAAHGLATVLVDIAADFKVGAAGTVNGYRATEEFARDIGGVIAYLRALTGKPVLVMGTSRGSLSVSNAVSKLSGATRPDGAVMTSALLSPKIPGLNVRSIVGDDPRLLAIPMLVVINIHDACSLTSPKELKSFATWYAGSHRKLATGSINSNITVDADPCEARTPHGFWGWDSMAVLNLSNWMKAMIAGLP
jgi:hypothetical protein